MSSFRKVAQGLAFDIGSLFMVKEKYPHQRIFKTPENWGIQWEKEIDKQLRVCLHKKFPEHSICSEEFRGVVIGTSEYTWVVDPLDGTYNFAATGIPCYAMCIALCRNIQPILGVIYAFGLNEQYVGELGIVSQLNGFDLKTAPEVDAGKSVIAFDWGKFDRKNDACGKSARAQAEFDRVICVLRRKVSYMPCFMSAAYQMALVASGRLDGYISFNLEPWDMAAAVPILQGAGKKVTNRYGKEWTLLDTSIFAASPSLHAELLPLIMSAAESFEDSAGA